MPIYIVTKKHREYEWNIGNANPCGINFQVCDVESITATDEELEHIHLMFKHGTIPHPWNRKSFNYYGDFARMIVGNL